MQDVHQLIYVSVFNSGRVDSALQSLREIIAVSRRNNARASVTGYLIFDGEGFLQVLEGERSPVQQIFSTIRQDPRHRDVKVIGALTARERAFRNWSMAGYLRRSDEAAIFARHGVVGQIAQAPLSAEQAVALVRNLADAQPQPIEG